MGPAPVGGRLGHRAGIRLITAWRQTRRL